MRQLRPAGTVAAGTIALLGILPLAVVAAHPALHLVSGADPYAACTPSGQGISHPGTAVEPSLAIDPRQLKNLIALWQQDRSSIAGSRGLVAASSFDGGRSWTETTLGFSRCAPDGLDDDWATDPWVSFGPDGIAYAVGLAVNIRQLGPNGFTDTAAVIITTRSLDGGRTWGDTHILTTRLGVDKPSITADPKRVGVAYAVWDDTSAGIALAMTTDGGATWSPPRRIFSGTPGSVGAGSPVLLADGQRLVTVVDYTRFAPDKTGFCRRSVNRQQCISVAHGKSRIIRDSAAALRSTNGGRTWSSPILIGASGGENIPSAGLDPTHHLFAVSWPGNDHGTAGNPLLATSTDGKHWSKPRAVTSAARHDFLSTVAVGEGRIAVTYYRTGRQRANAPVTYWLALSTDGGRHFTHTRVAGPFDLSKAPPTRGGERFLGDYQALVPDGRSFQALFAAPGPRVNSSQIWTTRVG